MMQNHKMPVLGVRGTMRMSMAQKIAAQWY